MKTGAPLTPGRCLLILLAGFIVCTALELNGSSEPCWAYLLRDADAPDSLLFGTPRQVRSDEWLVWTPAILAQANHQPAWPVENPSVGAGKSPLIMSLPVRHYTMWFRPQLWGFFLFGTERGFSWYWNTKVFGLLAAMFGLFYLLTEGRMGLALCGMALVFAASYVQWFFSCPPMLPEMLSMWALGLVCIITIGGVCSRWVRVAATMGLVIGAVNFALCCYPPFQIPLTYLGAAIIIGWFWKRWPGRGAWICYGVAGLCMAAVLIPFFMECLPTLHMVAGTSYPGARRSSGGGISFVSLLRGIAGPLLFEKSYPDTMANVCESSGFFPFALAAIPLLAAAPHGIARRLIIGCEAVVALLVLFSLMPMPQWLAAITGLNLTTTERWILPIGIGNIVIAILLLPYIASIPFKRRCVAWGIAMGVVAAWLIDAGGANPVYLTGWRTLALAAGAAVIFASYLMGRPGLFALCSLGVLGPAALSVNPVSQGLSPLLDAPAALAIREIAHGDPAAKWAAYDSGMLSQFLDAQGVPVISGAQTVPDLRFYDQLDPSHASRGIYNRYGIGVFDVPDDAGEVSFKLLNFCSYIVKVAPGNPVLTRAGVRFFVFPNAMDLAGLELVKALPDDKMWIYRENH